MQSALVQPDKKSSIAKIESRAGKYLVFRLGREEFGISVLKVREIMRVQGITAVPQTPPHVRGIINLRGKVIPVVGLRLKFGLPEIADGQNTCIVIVQIQTEHGSTQMGVVVDAVVEVLNLVASDIADTPDFGSGPASPYLLGMAKIKNTVKILLDIDRVMAGQELSGLEALAREQLL